MSLRAPILCALAAVFLANYEAAGETVKDREGAVRDDRAKMEDNERWIYNDIQKGFDEAKRTGRPLMVVLRCVPCLSCMGIDTQVLVENAELTPLMDEFVRVRVINANALDLSLFQFDYDLSFSTLFFNGDGTIYGRYGSWDHQKDSQNQATATFRQALEGALEIHRNYPANQASLAGKKGEPMRYKTPVAMPQLKQKYDLSLDWQGKVVQSCVHCHQVGDAIRKDYRETAAGIPEKWIYAYPAPDTIGIALSDEDVHRVEAVTADSPASRAGLKAGDEILSLSGQPLISSADFSWVLHNAPEAGTLPAVVKRGDQTANLNLELPADWRKKTDITTRVGAWPMRAMAFGGMKLDVVPDEERSGLGLEPGSLALRAAHVGQYGEHALAKKEGFQKGDILVEVDGSNAACTEGDLIGHLIRSYKPGTKVPAVILRNGQRKPIRIPVQ